MPLNNTLKNGENGTFYNIFFTTIKKELKYLITNISYKVKLKKKTEYREHNSNFFIYINKKDWKEMHQNALVGWLWIVG